MWFERFNHQTLVLSSSSGGDCGSGTDDQHGCRFGYGFEIAEGDVSTYSSVKFDDDLINIIEVDSGEFAESEVSHE